MALSTTGPGDSVQGKADVSLAAWQARRQGQDSRQHLRDPSQHLCPTRAGARKRAASLRGSNVLKFSSCTLSSVPRSTIPSPLSHSKPAPDSRLAFESKLFFFQLRLLPWMVWGVHLCWLQQKEKELLLFKTYSSFPSRLLSAVTWRVFSPFSRDIQLRKQVSPQTDKQQEKGQLSYFKTEEEHFWRQPAKQIQELSFLSEHGTSRDGYLDLLCGVSHAWVGMGKEVKLKLSHTSQTPQAASRLHKCHLLRKCWWTSYWLVPLRKAWEGGCCLNYHLQSCKANSNHRMQREGVQ